MKKGDKVLYWDGDRGVVDKVYNDKYGHFIADITYTHNGSPTSSTENLIEDLMIAGMIVFSKPIIVIRQ